MAGRPLSDDPAVNLICGLVPRPGVGDDPEAYLLDDDTFEQVLHDLENASFPLRWAPARVALRSDRQARVLLLGRELDEGTLRAQAEVHEPDDLLELLERTLEHLPTYLAQEVRDTIKRW